MAKTPLLNTLHGLFRDARTARARDWPLAKLRDVRAARLERDNARGVSRRAFLKGAGAVTAATAVPRFSFAAAQPTVVIVGAGIAGLNCALELADLGIASTVYEASGRIGGRMFSNTGYWNANQITEWCGELIDTGHTTVRKLAKRFDLPLDNLLAAQPHRSDDIYHFFGGYYPKSRADQDFLAVSDLIAADADAAGFPTTFDSNTPAGRALDRMSVHEYIERRIPGGHRSPLGALLDAAYVIEYGADSREQSALNLIFLLGFQPQPRSLSVFGESDEKFHIRGGNQQLPERMADCLGGDRRQDGSASCARERNGGRPVQSHLRARRRRERRRRRLRRPGAAFRGAERDRSVGSGLRRPQAPGDRPAGPRPQRQAAPAVRRAQLARCGSMARHVQRLELCGHRIPGRLGSHARAGRATRHPGFLLGRISDRRRGSTDQAFATAENGGVRADAAVAQSQIAAVYPGLSWNGKATQSLPHKSPLFNSSYAFYKVGQYTTFGGYEGERQGGVLFCGEHTSIDFQGFMEGAASEGRRAGRQVARMMASD